MEKGHRVMWSEMRDMDGSVECFYVIAEGTTEGWHFFERSCYELRWYPVPFHDCLVRKALSELDANRGEQRNIVAMRRAA